MTLAAPSSARACSTAHATRPGCARASHRPAKAGGFKLLDTQFVTDHLRISAPSRCRGGISQAPGAALSGEGDFAALGTRQPVTECRRWRARRRSLGVTRGASQVVYPRRNLNTRMPGVRSVERMPQIVACALETISAAARRARCGGGGMARRGAAGGFAGVTGGGAASEAAARWRRPPDFCSP